MLNLSHGRLQRFGGIGMVMILLVVSAASAQLPIDPRIRNLIEDAPPLAADQDGQILEGLRLFLEQAVYDPATGPLCKPQRHR